MADKVSRKTRSYIMSRIRSKDTKAEIAFRKELFHNGIRYRLHYPVEGRPDIALPSQKIAIFIDGCFWHKCPKCFRPPKSHKNYWEQKINRNLERDKIVNKMLKMEKWKVIRIWEHEITETPQKALRKVLTAIPVESNKTK